MAFSPVMSGMQPFWMSGDPSGLSQYERVSLRMWGHDIQDDGLNNGSVILKTLLNAKASGNEAFLKDTGSVQTVYSHLYQDYFDDYAIDGSSLRRSMANTYAKVTGHDIWPQLSRAPYIPANLSYSEVFRPAPDMKTPQGLQQMVRDTGLSLNNLLNTSLWGHDAIDQFGPGGRNLDGSVLAPALNDPQSIDFGFVNSSPETRAYTAGLINRDVGQFGRVTGNALNTDFLRALGTIYRIPGQL